MTNEIIRPCTLPASWKQPNGRPIEPFDAMDYLYYELNCYSNSIGSYEILLFNHTGVFRRGTFCCGEGKGDYFYVLKQAKIECHLLSLVIAQALNPPIKVTQAVLDAMEKVPEASFWYVEGSVNVRLKWDETLKTFTVNGQTLSITDYIQADCPLALQVLFQFNTEGEKYA
jgi:hypothetical protein